MSNRHKPMREALDAISNRLTPHVNLRIHFSFDIIHEILTGLLREQRNVAQVIGYVVVPAQLSVLH